MSEATAVVLVHGVPETAAVWGPLVAELGRSDVTCLSPPGFGAPIPDGFSCSADAYRDWLIAELERFDGPVDLVGHDWGGGHAVNLAMTRPDLLRSWVSDILGAFDPEYVWHPLAQIWQTPERGEAAVARLTGATLAQRTETLVGLGIRRPVAERLAAGQDAAMGRAILALYRSAAQPALAQLGTGLERAAERPGLCVLATGDEMVGSEVMRRRSAARAGAEVAVLTGLGHWWMVEDPARGAGVLNAFWASLPG